MSRSTGATQFPARALLVGSISLAVVGAVYAEERGAHCVGVADDARRLACYDESFGRDVSAAPAEPVAVAPAAAASAGAAEAEFGQVDLKRKEEQSSPPVPESISAVVLRVERNRLNLHTVWLDNQQVWRQTEESSGLRIDVGDTVNIRRRMFGSHVIRTADSDRSARVERVE